MSHVAVANGQGNDQSTDTTNGHLNSIWKKNLDQYSESECYSHRSNNTSEERNATKETLLSPLADRGMNHNYFRQQQQASNKGNVPTSSVAIANPTLNRNNDVVSMQPPNHNSSHPTSQQGHNAWFQHIILNPIHPLHNNSNTNASVGNGTSAFSNQVNALAHDRQQQVQGDNQGNTTIGAYLQQPHQLAAQLGGVGIQSIAGSKQQQQQQQTLAQPVIPLQPQQQQQNQHQLLPLNDLASQLQIQVPAVMQTQPLQQQPVAATTNRKQPVTMQSTTSTSTPAQQQQQLILLALMLQQQNNITTNSGSNSVDASALATALTSTEGLLLINSLIMGQPAPQVQHQNQHQHQLAPQVPQGKSVVPGPAGPAPAPPSTSLGVDHLSPSLMPGIQDGGVLSGHHQLLLSQQQSRQQAQPPKQYQSQVLSQPLQLPPSFLSPTAQSSLAPIGLAISGDSSIRSAAINFMVPVPSDTISNLVVSSDSQTVMRASKTSEDRGVDVTGSNNNNGINANTTPTVNPRFPRLLYCKSDDAILGEYQTLLRQQLELFEADSHDVINGTFRQGRTTPIRLGQIGLRCKHCSKSPMSTRTKGSVYCE